MTLGKFHPVDVPVWGELSVTAAAIEAELKVGTGSVDQRPEVADRQRI